MVAVEQASQRTRTVVPVRRNAGRDLRCDRTTPRILLEILMTTPSPWQLPKLTRQSAPAAAPRAVKPYKPLNAGERYGQWTILSSAPARSDRANEFRPRAYYLVQCACGTRKEVARDNLVNGLSKSCGCAKRALKGALKGNRQASSL